MVRRWTRERTGCGDRDRALACNGSTLVVFLLAAISLQEVFPWCSATTAPAVYLAQSVSSVDELRRALANAQVDRIHLLKDIKLTTDAWPENQTVTVAYPRAVTITSRPGLTREHWPLVEFTGIRRRITLQSTNITFSRVWIYKSRATLSNLAYPGADILSATGNPPSTYTIQDSVSIQVAGSTYETFTRSPNYLPSVQAKRPAAHPGNQTLFPPGSEPLCRAASNLYGAYCWPTNHTYTAFDFALPAMDDDAVVPAGTTSFAGYYVLIRNVTSVNNFLITAECMQNQGAESCIRQAATQNAHLGAVPVASGHIEEQSGHRTCGGTCIILACVLGGGGAVAAVLGAMFGLRAFRRRKQAQEQKAAGLCATDALIKNSLHVAAPTGGATPADDGDDNYDDGSGGGLVMGSSPVRGGREGLSGACSADDPSSPQVVTVMVPEDATGFTIPVTPNAAAQENVRLNLKLSADVQVGDCLGYGFFSSVMRGTYDGQPVAVKLLQSNMLCHLPSAAVGAPSIDMNAPCKGAFCIGATASAMEVQPATGASLLFHQQPQQQQQQQQHQALHVSSSATSEHAPAEPIYTAGAPTNKAIQATATLDREVRILSRCRHPNVVRLLGAGLDSQQPFLVLELMVGGSLASLLRPDDDGDEAAATGAAGDGGSRPAVDAAAAMDVPAAADVGASSPAAAPPAGAAGSAVPPSSSTTTTTTTTTQQPQGRVSGAESSNAIAYKQLPLQQVLLIARDIAAGLAYLHPTVVHRDLKPANVLLDALGQAKLADFGLSSLTAGTIATEHPAAGTAPYLAPECFTHSAITEKVDIFSFGVLLWEMLTGRQPWPGLSPLQVGMAVAMKGERLPLPPAADSERCPPRLRKLIEACWDGNPARRPAAVDALKQLTLLLRERGELPARYYHSGIISASMPMLVLPEGSRDDELVARRRTLHVSSSMAIDVDASTTCTKSINVSSGSNATEQQEKEQQKQPEQQHGNHAPPPLPPCTATLAGDDCGGGGGDAHRSGGKKPSSSEHSSKGSGARNGSKESGTKPGGSKEWGKVSSGSRRLLAGRMSVFKLITLFHPRKTTAPTGSVSLPSTADSQIPVPLPSTADSQMV